MLSRVDGFVSGTTIVDDDSLLSLTVTVSIIFADSTGKMIGYTPPFPVTAGTEVIGFYTAGPLIMYPNPGLAGQVRSIGIVQVRNPTNLGADLYNDWLNGKNLWTIEQALTVFI